MLPNQSGGKLQYRGAQLYYPHLLEILVHLLRQPPRSIVIQITLASSPGEGGCNLNTRDTRNSQLLSSLNQ